MHTTAHNGNRLAAYCDDDASPVEVIATHRSRRRICRSMRTDLRLLPTSVRVTVRTPAGVVVEVIVKLWVEGEYVRASADPYGRVNGEDPDSTCEFPLSSELEAERLALEAL